MARFFAYQNEVRTWSHAQRDESSGVLGSIAPTRAPLFEADDLDALQLSAWAHLGREPDDLCEILLLIALRTLWVTLPHARP